METFLCISEFEIPIEPWSLALRYVPSRIIANIQYEKIDHHLEHMHAFTERRRTRRKT